MIGFNIRLDVLLAAVIAAVIAFKLATRGLDRSRVVELHGATWLSASVLVLILLILDLGGVLRLNLGYWWLAAPWIIVGLGVLGVALRRAARRMRASEREPD